MLRIEVEEETDGRFIAEGPDLPGVMAYGHSRDEAIIKVEAPARALLRLQTVLLAALPR